MHPSADGLQKARALFSPFVPEKQRLCPVARGH